MNKDYELMSSTENNSSKEHIHQEVDIKKESSQIQSVETCTENKRTRKYKPPQILTRKRQTNKAKWQAVEKKILVNTGQEYTNASGKLKEKRVPRKSCDKSCRFKCISKITEQQRNNLCKEFWDLGDHFLQWGYLNEYMIIEYTNKNNFENKDESNTEKKIKSKYTIRYFLNVNNEKVKFCRTIIMSTLAICERWIKT